MINGENYESLSFKNRETDINSIEKELKEIEKSEFIKEQWEAYSKKHSYTNDIDFETIIEKLRQINELIKREE